MSLRRTMRLYGLAVVAAVAACGPALHTGRARTAPIARPEAELERALTLVRRGDFRRAQTVLQRLTFEFGPSQPQLAVVRYYLAESSFQLGDRVSAAHGFRQVAEEFPASEYAPLALLRAGDSHLRMWRRAELDPTNGETALSIYQELAGRYPDSDAAARARLHVRRLQEQLAEKTYKNGLFYFRRKAYDSAILYFKDVVSTYPEATRAPLALLRMVDSYRAIGYKEELQETCGHLRRFYPRAPGLELSCPPDSSGAPS